MAYAKTKKLMKEGHKGRETGHHSEVAYEKRAVNEPYHTYWSRYSRANAYGFNEELHAVYNAGFPGLWVQDAACQSGVMPIYDRSRENLGTSDSGVARTRRVLLEAARKLATEEIRPASAQEPDKFLVRAISIMIPAGSDWMELGRDYMKAELGKGFGYTP